MSTTTQGGRRGSAQEAPIADMKDAALSRRLLRFARPWARWFVASLLLMPISATAGLLQPHLMQLVIDEHLTARRWDGVGTLIGVFVGMIALEYIAKFGLSYIMQIAGQRVLRDLRVAVFDRIQHLSMAWFHRNPVGRVMTRLTSDIDALQEALSSGVVTIVGDVLTLSAIVVILLLKSWKLALVTFAVVPVLLGLSVLFRRLLRGAYRELRSKIARLNATLQEAVTGMAIIQLFVHEARSRREYEEVNAAHRDAAYSVIRWDASLYALVEMISSMAVAGIIWYGAGESLEGVVTLGVLVAFVEYVGRFFGPIRDLSQTWAVIQSAFASAERLFEILDSEDVIDDAPDRRPIQTLAQGIEFRNVWFAYKGEQWVLRDVSFVIRRGEKVALVGHTGAGKTTITALLTRLHDVQRGQILIDGHDIREYRLEDVRRLFTVVLQDAFLFSGTLGDNLTLRAPHVTAEDVQRAIQIVGVDRLVARYDDGLEHAVRERRGHLWGGGRQLVAFARALAHRPDVLILDEATANVDTETEALIQRATEAMLSQQTSVVIAHRLSTIQRVDRIVVMHRGEVAEQGTHAELLAQGGLYARLVRLQYG